MSEEHKKRVTDALNKYYERQDREIRKLNGLDGPRRRNDKPEKEVEKACLAWMRAPEQDWLVEIYEAKSTLKDGVWRQQAMKAGTCDCMGSLPNGIGVAIEFKAPGRLASFNSEKRFLQRKFIVDRINSNNFACVTDSVERLKIIYEKWRELRSENVDFGVARNYLLSMLPQQREKTRLDDDRLFDDE